MKSTILVIAGILTIVFTPLVFANTAPSVSNVTVSQRTDGSGIVDISYTLSDADNDDCTVGIEVSNDGGSSWTVTATAFSGDIGGNISPGSRHITWNSKSDLPGAFGSNYRVKVTADDGQGPSGMEWVYINDPGVSGHEPFNGYMSKYETTNAQYAQYLNAAKASGDVTVSGSYVVGTSGPYSGQNYYYLAGSGYTYNGATNGGAARINWTGSSFTVDGGFDNHPVTYVSWYGSTAFANYYGWRLPTEWEWQAVADHYGEFSYGCGVNINNSIANYRDSVHPYGTTVVGSFGTYGYGMCDMAGNVWEWTDSCYYAGCSPDYRVLRGGCWYNIVILCVVSYRHDGTSPRYTHGSLGFRVCR